MAVAVYPVKFSILVPLSEAASEIIANSVLGNWCLYENASLMIWVVANSVSRCKAAAEDDGGTPKLSEAIFAKFWWAYL